MKEEKDIPHIQAKFDPIAVEQVINGAAKRIKKPERELPILSGCIFACTDLLANQWDRIRDIGEQADNAKLSISLSIEVDRGGARPKVHAKIGYSRKYSDDTEFYIDDPAQVKMDFNEKPKKQKALALQGGSTQEIHEQEDIAEVEVYTAESEESNSHAEPSDSTEELEEEGEEERE